MKKLKRKDERRIWIAICIVLLLLLLYCWFTTGTGLCGLGLGLGETFGIGTRDGGPIKISEKCNDLCLENGYEIGLASKTDECLEEGSFLEEKLITETFYIYDAENEVHCCCHNVDTCEEHGYYGRVEGSLDNWEIVSVGGLTCWKLKEVEKYVCCEKYNMDKTGEKFDITYAWTVTCTNDGGFDGFGVVSDDYCTGPK